MTEALKAAGNFFFIRPLSAMDKRVHDYTLIKDYVTITLIVNMALAAISAFASRPILARLIRQYEIRNIPAPSLWKLTALVCSLAFALLSRTDSRRTQINDSRSLGEKSGTTPASKPASKASSTYRPPSIEDQLSRSDFSFMHGDSDVCWASVLKAAENIATEHEPLSVIFNRDSNGVSLFWNAVYCGVSAKYEIARGLLEKGADANRRLFIRESAFYDPQEFMFILRLVKEERLNAASIKIAKDVWKTLSDNTRMYNLQGLLLEHEHSYKKTGWEKQEELLTYVNETFDSTNNNCWK